MPTRLSSVLGLVVGLMLTFGSASAFPVSIVVRNGAGAAMGRGVLNVTPVMGLTPLPIGGGRSVNVLIAGPVADVCPGGLDKKGVACVASPSEKWNVTTTTPMGTGILPGWTMTIGVQFPRVICQCTTDPGYVELQCCGTPTWMADGGAFGFHTHDIELPVATDCNGNGVPDNEDIANGTSQDCNGNGVPDECEGDCNHNGISDACDIAQGAPDCNQNGMIDACEIAMGFSGDCNANGVPDDCDIANGAPDIDGNGVLDNCSTVGAALMGATSQLALSEPAPNPGVNGMSFRISVPGDMSVRVEMVDLAGRKVSEVFEGIVERGGRDITWSRPPGLRSGVYYLRLSGGGNTAKRTVILID